MIKKQKQRKKHGEIRKKNYTKSLIKGEIKEKLKTSKKINRKAVKNNREKLERKKLDNLQSGAACKQKQTKKTQWS